jgi:hypothetical protein
MNVAAKHNASVKHVFINADVYVVNYLAIYELHMYLTVV